MRSFTVGEKERGPNILGPRLTQLFQAAVAAVLYYASFFNITACSITVSVVFTTQYKTSPDGIL